MMPAKPSSPKFLSLRVQWAGLISAAGLIAAGATVAGFFGSSAWILDLFSHFRLQYLLGLSVIALLLLLLRRPKPAAIFGLFAIANLGTVLPLYLAKPVNVPSSNRSYRILLSNVNTGTGSPERVAVVIRQYHPDFVVLEEISQKWVTALKETIDSYPHTQIEPRDDNFGIGLLSRLPFIKCNTLTLEGAQLPSIMAEIQTGNGKFAILATHPLPPVGPAYSHWRNDQFTAISSYVHAANSELLLVGDLNTSPWSPFFRKLLLDSGLSDSAQGRGAQATWPAANRLMRIPLDHCLHSSNIQIISRQVGPDVGSDHFPIIVDFKIVTP